jgi:hypothetical protein
VNEGLCRLIVTDLHGKRENDTREVSEWACCFRQDLQGVKLGLWECHQKCESLATNGRGAKAIIGEHDASPLLLAGPAVRLRSLRTRLPTILHSLLRYGAPRLRACPPRVPRLAGGRDQPHPPSVHHCMLFWLCVLFRTFRPASRRLAGSYPRGHGAGSAVLDGSTWLLPHHVLRPQHLSASWQLLILLRKTREGATDSAPLTQLHCCGHATEGGSQA